MIQFRLVPFAPAEGAFSITGSVERQGPALRAAFTLAGDLSAIVLPPPAARERRDGLWRGTCFELFAGWPGKGRYLEVNLSPAGPWNVYGFSGYRTGMTPLAVRRFESWCRAAASLQVGLALEPEEDLPEGLEIGLSAVLLHPSGATSHWALAHGGDRPDFHQRATFLLIL